MAKKVLSFDTIRAQVLVIGAGASGMAAAVTAAEAGAHVAVLEHRKEAGKKILITGNGRCNLGNLSITASCFRSENPSFVRKIPGLTDAEKTIGFFRRRGIITIAEGPYLYPASGQASTVRDVLVRDMRALGVRLITGCEVLEILRGTEDGARFAVRTNLGTVMADTLILACGGSAAPATGSDGSGFLLAEKLGHTVIPPLPALVQLRLSAADVLREWAGIRVYGRISLLIGKDAAASDEGELQLTDYGISGIPVFQVSRHAARALAAKKPVSAVLDLWPAESGEGTEKRLLDRKRELGDRYASELLIGWFHRKIGDFLLARAEIPRNIRIREIPEEKLKRLLPLIHDLTFAVTGTNSFESAQTSCGGIDTAEVEPTTMMSRRAPGLFFAGEILDVDGICGGYNLHFAWLSGQIAGKSAACLGSFPESGETAERKSAGFSELGEDAGRKSARAGEDDSPALPLREKMRDKLHPEVVS
jgi:predicted Rossmann fold flavoprotein